MLTLWRPCLRVYPRRQIAIVVIDQIVLTGMSFITRVKPFLNPTSWVPPSCVRILLTKEYRFHYNRYYTEPPALTSSLRVSNKRLFIDDFIVSVDISDEVSQAVE